MTVDAALATAMRRLSDAQVHALVERCESRTSAPSSLGPAVAGGSPGAHDAVNELRAAWVATPGLTGSGVALALRTALAARQDTTRRRASPVWTGPRAVGEQQLTAAVLHELIASAADRVLLVSYAAYTLPAVADDLQSAVARGCAVDVVFETTVDSSGAYGGPSAPFASLAGITRWRWPADQRGTGAALHAKLLVIDGCQALIGSANLTHRALTANLEAGVLLRDPEVAESLEQHVHELMRAQILVKAT